MPRHHARGGNARRRPPKADQTEPLEAAQPPRIIGGELRGKRLAFTPDGQTRPMKDRVREVLFDLVGPKVKGILAVDLFAGTGALGFEAVSRGAAAAVMAERFFPTADQLRKTSRDLGIEHQVTVFPGDVLLWARRMPSLDTSRPWVVFVSPPWSMFHERTGEVMALIEACRKAAPAGSLIAVEADDAFDAAALPEREQWTCRPLPPAMLYLRTTGASPMDVVNHRDTVPFTTADGSTIRELLAHRNSSIRHQSLAEARLAPGAATTPHHHAKTEEIYYILSGTADMTLEQETRPVGAGDAIAIPPGQRHTIRNTGTDELVFLCTCAPGYEHDDTFLEPAEAPPAAS